MSEQPVTPAVAAPDPERIANHLPEPEREQFLQEYHAALDAAHEIWRYRQLQDVLRSWSLVAAAYAQPDFAARKAEAKHPRPGQFRPASEIIPGWEERVQAAH